MRINKYLANLGVASRRKIDAMIAENRIKINGEPVTHGSDVSSDDKITLDGKIIKTNAPKKVYYLLNKPLDVLSSASDDRGRLTVVDLIPTEERIYPIGRLDYNTSGLIILTNDGELFNKIIHPKAEVYKTYLATVWGSITESDLEKLRAGVELEDGKTLPAKVDIISKNKKTTTVKISIREGRNRQIRRMLKALGYNILSLHREKLGDIELDNLKMGEYRELTPREIEYLFTIK